jgi:uncharacterized membrane protein YqgA involved in biofilm formation
MRQAVQILLTTVTHMTSKQLVEQFMSWELRGSFANIGGMRGIIMVACGSSMTQAEHFKVVESLVKR